MRRVLATASAALAFAGLAAFAPCVARAQDPEPASVRDYKAQPLNLRKEQLGTAAYTNAARARMRAGDCEGALTSYDAALRTSDQDPTLFRDRGICHEKLGHPYPAIDDYRVYLTDAPEATDAPAIHDRLTKLEDETTGRSPNAATNDDTDVPPGTGDAAVSVGSGGASASASTGSHDKVETMDDDDPLNTPLKRGKGFTLAPFFSEHHWFFSGSSFGDAETWSETVGVQLRYSFSRVAAIVGEVGYEHFNASTSADPFTIAGLTSLLAIEFRLPLDPDYNNELLLAPGLGYEHVAYTPTDPDLASLSVNGLVPRMRFGYRHLFEEDAALDFSIDVGLAKWFAPSEDGVSLDIPNSAMVAANIGLVWGL